MFIRGFNYRFFIANSPPESRVTIRLRFTESKSSDSSSAATKEQPAANWFRWSAPRIVYLMNLRSLYGYFMTVSILICAFFYRPLWIIPRRVKWFDFSVCTIEVKHQTHRYADGQSASRPMFIRCFPLSGYLMTVSTPSFVNFIARCEWFRLE